MKRIYLVRHAEPKRLQGEADSLWPLTEQGHREAEILHGMDVCRVYSSPYRRAKETAMLAGLPVKEDVRLQERLPGEAIPEMGDCWMRQYEDPQFKCPGGESFDEVGQRMAECIDDVLDDMDEGSTALVVSHAAAICAFLMRHCSVQVRDRSTKTRSVIWQNHLLYTGNLPYLSGFALMYQRETLINMEGFDCVRSD